MKRRLRNLLTLMSLLLCLAFSAAWVRSYYSYEGALLALGSGQKIQVGWGRGQFVAVYRLGTQVKPKDGPMVRWVWGNPPRFDPLLASHLFFHRFRLQDLKGYTAVPAWFLVLIAAVLPISRVPTFLKRLRRNRLGLCLKCGYDVRGMKERCPECGTSVPSPAPAGEI